MQDLTEQNDQLSVHELGKLLSSLGRLEVVDFSEWKLIFNQAPFKAKHWLGTQVEAAEVAMGVVGAELEASRLEMLDYSSFKLRGIFNQMGCARLAFIFEFFHRNISKFNINLLREVFHLAEHEFEIARRAIASHQQIPESLRRVAS